MNCILRNSEQKKIIEDAAAELSKKFPNESIVSILNLIDMWQSENNKKVIVFNINHFFDEMLLALNKPFKEKFDDCDPTLLYTVVNSVEEIEKYLK